MTVITATNDERSRNKPIVRGRVHSKATKLFLDTGADINIIACEILGVDESFIKPTKSSVRCANNFNLKVVGECYLDVAIGSSSHKIYFLVVENIFPAVILGIVALKQMKVAIVPEESGAYVKNELVPFLSKVETKNEEELCLRVETKLRQN